MISAINLLLGKALAEREGLSDDRALQVGLIAGLMPGMQGVLLATLLARREAPVEKAPVEAAPIAKPPVETTAIDARPTQGGSGDRSSNRTSR